MSRISGEALVAAIQKVRAMDLKAKERLADEIHDRQPHMLGEFLVQKQFGVSLPKMDFLLDILFVCFQAMKESKLDWPLITEDEQDLQLSRYTASVKHVEDLGGTLGDRALADYINSHPEKELLAFVQVELNKWLAMIEPEESDKFVMMVAMNYVNCIAYVPMSEPNNAAPPTRGTLRALLRR